MTSGKPREHPPRHIHTHILGPAPPSPSSFTVFILRSCSCSCRPAGFQTFCTFLGLKKLHHHLLLLQSHVETSRWQQRHQVNNNTCPSTLISTCPSPLMSCVQCCWLLGNEVSRGQRWERLNIILCNCFCSCRQLKGPYGPGPNFGVTVLRSLERRPLVYWSHWSTGPTGLTGCTCPLVPLVSLVLLVHWSSSFTGFISLTGSLVSLLPLVYMLHWYYCTKCSTVVVVVVSDTFYVLSSYE